MLRFKEIAPEVRSASEKTGHEWFFSKDKAYIIKLNKHGRVVCSLIEFFASKIIHKLLPELTPDIELVLDELKDDQHKVVGVAVKREETFIDLSKINIIRLIADIENKKNNYNPSKIDQDKLKKIRQYYEDEKQGEARRKFYMKHYFLTVFIRNLLQEDDQHKGNLGCCWREEPQTGEKVLWPFAIDFDLLFQEAIGANFNMVRRSQWGSPYGKFKITLRDIVNFPFIKDSVPGHNPGIEANSLEAKSFTNNKGRYSKEDVLALKYICSNDKYDSLRKRAIINGLKKLLQIDPSTYERDFSAYGQKVLRENVLIDLDPESRFDFPHMFAVEVAKLQLQIYKALQGVEAYPADETFKNDLIELRNQHARRFERYASAQEMSKIRETLMQKYKCHGGDGIVSSFKADIESLENNFYLHSDVKAMKLLTTNLFECVVDKCNLTQLAELVDWWSKLESGYILRARESGWVARIFKNYFYNRNVTTYVTLRDTLLKKALSIHTTNKLIDKIMLTLLTSDSLFDSHSERPVSFFDRVRLEFIRLFCGTYRDISLFQSYLAKKSGWELILFKSIIFAPAVIVKDIVKFYVEMIPFVVQCFVRYPRRWAADGMRYLLRRKSDFFKLKFLAWGVCVLTYIAFTVAQTSLKFLVYLGGKITSPIISARRDSEWVRNILMAHGVNHATARVVEEMVYYASLVVSTLLLLVSVKVFTMMLVETAVFISFAAIHKAFLVFVQPVAQTAISLFAAVNLFIQAITNRYFNKTHQAQCLEDKSESNEGRVSNSSSMLFSLVDNGEEEEEEEEVFDFGSPLLRRDDLQPSEQKVRDEGFGRCETDFLRCTTA